MSDFSISQRDFETLQTSRKHDASSQQPIVAGLWAIPYSDAQPALLVTLGIRVSKLIMNRFSSQALGPYRLSLGTCFGLKEQLLTESETAAGLSRLCVSGFTEDDDAEPAPHDMALLLARVLTFHQPTIKLWTSQQTLQRIFNVEFKALGNGKSLSSQAMLYIRLVKPVVLQRVILSCPAPHCAELRTALRLILQSQPVLARQQHLLANLTHLPAHLQDEVCTVYSLPVKQGLITAETAIAVVAADDASRPTLWLPAGLRRAIVRALTGAHSSPGGHGRRRSSQGLSSNQLSLATVGQLAAPLTATAAQLHGFWQGAPIPQEGGDPWLSVNSRARLESTAAKFAAALRDLAMNDPVEAVDSSLVIHLPPDVLRGRGWAVGTWLWCLPTAGYARGAPASFPSSPARATPNARLVQVYPTPDECSSHPTHSSRTDVAYLSARLWRWLQDSDTTAKRLPRPQPFVEDDRPRLILTAARASDEGGPLHLAMAPPQAVSVTLTPVANSARKPGISCTEALRSILQRQSVVHHGEVFLVTANGPDHTSQPVEILPTVPDYLVRAQNAHRDGAIDYGAATAAEERAAMQLQSGGPIFAFVVSSIFTADDQLCFVGRVHKDETKVVVQGPPMYRHVDASLTSASEETGESWPLPDALQEEVQVLSRFFQRAPTKEEVSPTVTNNTSSTTSLPAINAARLLSSTSAQLTQRSISQAARLAGLQMVNVDATDLLTGAVSRLQTALTECVKRAAQCRPAVLVLSNALLLFPVSKSRSAAEATPTTLPGLDQLVPRLLDVLLSEAEKVPTVDGGFGISLLFVVQQPSSATPSALSSLWPLELVQRVPTLLRLSALTPHAKRQWVASACHVPTALVGAFTDAEFATLDEDALEVAAQEARRRAAADSGAVVAAGGLQQADWLAAGLALSSDHLLSALRHLQTKTGLAEGLGSVKVERIDWADVGGMEEAKRLVLETVELPLLRPHLLPPGLRRTGLLLYGPPGTGKTLLARAVASQCKAAFLSVKGPELLNMFVGQSEANVREVFARARSAAPCVIFFDELDALAPARGRSYDSGAVMDRVVSQLLTEMDGVNKSADIFVIGATNRPDLLDSALLRPGRLDKMVYLGVPATLAEKTKVFQAVTRRCRFAEDLQLSDIIQQLPEQCTNADIAAVGRKAVMAAAEELIMATSNMKESHLSVDDLVLQAHHFARALQDFQPSLSAEQLRDFEQLQSQYSSS